MSTMHAFHWIPSEASIAINSSLEGLTLLYSKRGKNNGEKNVGVTRRNTGKQTFFIFLIDVNILQTEFTFHFWIRRRANSEELSEYPILFLVLYIQSFSLMTHILAAFDILLMVLQEFLGCS